VPDVVQLLGLDFGTTTSSAVVASAPLLRGAVSGRMELGEVRERFRSPLVFTPLDELDRLDVSRLERLLDGWLAAGDVHPDDLFGGGALLTGLTAQKDNAAALVGLIRRRVGRALVATADDPCLESWLAFMGSVGPLSRAHPHQHFLNLDVGGGTTNLALGRDGDVSRTGCLFVGARHVRVEPGTYRVVRLSRYARLLFDALGIRAAAGDELTEQDVRAVVDRYVRLLEAAVVGDGSAFVDPVAMAHVQVLYRPPDGGPRAHEESEIEPGVTFSGGVGELIYAHLAGRPWPGTTHFGDLGIDLARRILVSPTWAESLATYRPSSAGRATVYGLLRHSTEISGSTIFLADPSLLPLTDVPILGGVGPSSSDDDLRELLSLVARSGRGGCLRVTVGGQDADRVRSLGGRLADAVEHVSFPSRLPLVLLVRENVGKTLGHYVTRWGRLPLALLAIDEIALRDAQYAQIGAPRGPVVPVSFFGLSPRGVVPCSR